MAKKKFVVGCFDNEDVLFPAVKKVRTAGYKIHDVYTPFPCTVSTMQWVCAKQVYILQVLYTV